MSLMEEMGAKALKMGIPLSVQVDVTYRCNERCPLLPGPQRPRRNDHGRDQGPARAWKFRPPDLKEFRMSRLFNKCPEASEWNSPPQQSSSEEGWLRG